MSKTEITLLDRTKHRPLNSQERAIQRKEKAQDKIFQCMEDMRESGVKVLRTEDNEIGGA